MTFPDSPLLLTVALIYNDPDDIEFIDITDDIRGSFKISNVRGRRNERARPGFGIINFTLSNPDGKYSPKNPASEHFGRIGKNMLLHVSIDGDVRAVYEVSRFNPRRSLDGRVQWVEVEASGIIRRLSQGAKALRSVAYRVIMAPMNDPYRVFYFPLEEESNATSAFSPIAGAPTLQLTGDYTFGLFTQSPIAQRMLTFGATGLLNLTVPEYDSSAGTHKFVSLVQFPAAGDLPDETIIWRVHSTGTTVVMWDLIYDAGGALRLQGYAPSGAIVDTNGPWAFDVDGQHKLVSLEWTQDGADIDTTISISGPDDPGGIGPHTFTGATIGRVHHIATGLHPLDGVSIGHLAFTNDVVFALSNFGPHPLTGARGVAGYDGEAAGRRFQRLCSEEDVLFAAIGDMDATETMGPQGVETFMELLYQCMDVDQGIGFETRTGFGLTYRARTSMYNQAPAFTLDQDQAHLSVKQLEPDDSDATTWNDVNLSRPSGSEARAVLDEPYTDHAYSTQEPPFGVGTYDRGVTTMPTETDDGLQLLAWWILHHGTFSADYRYPEIGDVNLARQVFVNDSALAAAVQAADIGDLFAYDNPPTDVCRPGTQTLLIQGVTEVIGRHEWTFKFHTTPGWAWEVWPVDTGGSTLVQPRDDNDTSLKIATSSGPPWEETFVPYLVEIHGEPMKVTAVSTDTPAFIAAGAAAHGNNASVSPGLPAGMTVDVGQVIICHAAIRNSGTGTVDLPTDWVSLANFGNERVFGKYYETGDTAPTVTFTGGVAGADTSAQLYGFSGTSLELDGGRYLATAVSPQTQLNSSAQDVAYPALSIRRAKCVAFLFIWKQDDWTSVATPAAFDAEMGEPDTTTGDDQGIAAYYDIQSTATDLAAGTAVVTGGASAISRAITLALRPLQTMTVERGVAGTAVALEAGDTVNVWRMGVMPL